MSDHHPHPVSSVDDVQRVPRNPGPPTANPYTEHIRRSEQLAGEQSLPRTAAFNDRVRELHQRIERIDIGAGSSHRVSLSRTPSPTSPDFHVWSPQSRLSRSPSSISPTSPDSDIRSPQSRLLRSPSAISFSSRLQEHANNLQRAENQLRHLIQAHTELQNANQELREQIAAARAQSLETEGTTRRRYTISEQSPAQIESLITQLENDRPDNPTPTAARFSAQIPAISPAMQYVDDLQVLSVEDLEIDEQTCSICQEPYLNKDDLLNEPPVILPNCGHIFGGACIEKWLDPHIDEPRNTCPLCRDVLFEMPHVPESDFIEDDFTAQLIQDPFAGASPAEFLVLLEQIGLHAADQDRLRAADRDAFRTLRTLAIPHHHDPSFPNMSNLPPMPFLSPTTSSSLLSSQILTHFRHMSYFVGADAVHVAQAMARLMGQLMVRLKDTLAMMQFGAPWVEEGPPISFLLDPEVKVLLEIALEKMVQVEEVWMAMQDDEDDDRESDVPER